MSAPSISKTWRKHSDLPVFYFLAVAISPLSSLATEPNDSVQPVDVLRLSEMDVGEAAVHSAQNCFLRPCDSVWEISSRKLPCCPIDNAPELMQYRSLSEEQSCLRWQDTAQEELLATTALKPLVVLYAHGNWNSVTEARGRATKIYRAMKARYAGPIQFIMYSWPSDREKGFAKDIQQKQKRLESESHHLASFMQRLPYDACISLMGFSFGCPIVFGALHLESGGTLGSICLTEHVHRLNTYRVSLTAPAFDRNYLQPNGRFKYSLCNVEKVVSLYSSNDAVLKRFRFVDTNYSPVAAGYAGLPKLRACCSPLTSVESGEVLNLVAPELCQYDCRASVGRSHSEVKYITESSAFRKSIDNLIRQ